MYFALLAILVTESNTKKLKQTVHSIYVNFSHVRAHEKIVALPCNYSTLTTGRKVDLCTSFLLQDILKLYFRVFHCCCWKLTCLFTLVMQVLYL